MNAKTPYTDLPDHCFWSRSRFGKQPADFDPVLSAPFSVNKNTKIISAGSCFAQHIANRLLEYGYNYLVTEPGHPAFSDKMLALFNYGTFSARYGNLYTVRQLLQLAQRATGAFEPKENVWQQSGRFIDPYRPTIQPDGFSRNDDFLRDRLRHYEAVCRAFSDCDVMIFTLGLTEAWVSKQDGAVFPICPGVSGGRFNEAKHEFKNFTVEEIVADFTAFLDIFGTLNSHAQILLTVSPVPLAATARADQSVITATTYSKSVLRVACEMLRQKHERIHYFPSYEVIVATSNVHRYYDEKGRGVTSAGVDHVMRLFMKHYANDERAVGQKQAAKDRDNFIAENNMALDAVCDEEALDQQ